MTTPDIRDDEGRYHGKTGTTSEHRTVGDHRAWCLNCHEWCYPDAPCGEPRCCTTLTTSPPTILAGPAAEDTATRWLSNMIAEYHNGDWKTWDWRTKAQDLLATLTHQDQP